MRPLNGSPRRRHHGDGEQALDHLGTTGGVVAGTALGIAVLRKIPEKAFGRSVSFIVLVIAILLLVRPPFR